MKKEKKVKIFLSVVLTVIIVFLLWKGLADPPPLPPINGPTNKFVDRIKNEIDSLSKLKANAFSDGFYNSIHYRINEFHKGEHLGEDEYNDKWEEALLQNLDSTYAYKFVEQAMYVFNRTEWKETDLKKISSEVTRLKKSVYLNENDSIFISFQKIDNILKKYGDIENFIKNYNKFPKDTNITAKFPISIVSEKIQRSRIYLNNKLDNVYVNNCSRLKDGLGRIPQNLFNEHIRYLRIKIQNNADKYKEYHPDDQKTYIAEIYSPLEEQLEALEALNHDIYKIDDKTYEKEYKRIKDLLNALDGEEQSKYFWR